MVRSYWGGCLDVILFAFYRCCDRVPRGLTWTVVRHMFSHFGWALFVRKHVSVYLELWTCTQAEGVSWTGVYMSIPWLVHDPIKWTHMAETVG